MKRPQNRLNWNGLAVVLVLTAGASPSAFARAISDFGGFGSQGGSGGVFGHIDIPEIGYLPPPSILPGGSDPFAGTIGFEDLDGTKAVPVRIIMPGDFDPVLTGGAAIQTPDLFPPGDGHGIGFIPVDSVFGGDHGGNGAAPVALTPVFQVPTPGAATLLLTAAGLVAGRRRRR